MIWKLLLTLLLHGRVCVASVFGYPGDQWAGGKACCIGRRVRPGDVGIAHRTLPCGTRVALMNPRTWRVIVAEVVDRGPYGARMADGTWGLKMARRDPGRWRGCIDLTPAAAEALDHDGFERVIYTVIE